MRELPVGQAEATRPVIPIFSTTGHRRRLPTPRAVNSEAPARWRTRAMTTECDTAFFRDALSASYRLLLMTTCVAFGVETCSVQA
jgi:hypothetical protein